MLLPLAAGAAGALSLSQAQRSSLVSGAAIGILVAAALAPPAGLIGMATVMGRWELVLSGGFLLGLQLFGINLSGAVVFRLFGLSPAGPRYSRGRHWVVWLSLAVTIGGLAGLMLLQFGTTSPTLQRTTVEQRVRSTVLDVIKQDGSVEAASTTITLHAGEDSEPEHAADSGLCTAQAGHDRVRPGAQGPHHEPGAAAVRSRHEQRHATGRRHHPLAAQPGAVSAGGSFRAIPVERRLIQ